jgi:flagellar assembly protein FliH
MILSYSGKVNVLKKADGRVQAMEYPSLAGTRAPVIDLALSVNLTNRVRELESKLEEGERQVAQTLERVRLDAMEQGKRQAGCDQAAWRGQCAALLKEAVDEFRAHRDEYVAQVEREVVRLALAIAERILHRELQLDPLLLSGAVRVALGQLAESTEVHLRVPTEQKDMWTEMVRLMPGLSIRPEVRGDEHLQAGEVGLETNLGTVDLGMLAQLEEIERGFFDQVVSRGSKEIVVDPDPNGKQI